IAADGRYAEARGIFSQLAQDVSVKRPDSDWLQLNIGLCQLLENDSEAAEATFQELKKRELFSVEEALSPLASFFPEAARIMTLPGPVAPGTMKAYARDNYEAFAFLLYGLKNWQFGQLEPAGEILRQFLACRPSGQWDWILEYQPLAQKFLHDFDVFEPLNKDLKTATTPETKAALLERVREAKGQVQTGAAIEARLDEMEARLSRS
ncbi:MAG TPA: hypothetical protein VIS74_06680, partial [Chthoniobacterales bacterium]